VQLDQRRHGDRADRSLAGRGRVGRQHVQQFALRLPPRSAAASARRAVADSRRNATKAAGFPESRRLRFRAARLAIRNWQLSASARGGARSATCR
jgi:hypothetical protein